MSSKTPVNTKNALWAHRVGKKNPSNLVIDTSSEPDPVSSPVSARGRKPSMVGAQASIRTSNPSTPTGFSNPPSSFQHGPKRWDRVKQETEIMNMMSTPSGLPQKYDPIPSGSPKSSNRPSTAHLSRRGSTESESPLRPKSAKGGHQATLEEIRQLAERLGRQGGVSRLRMMRKSKPNWDAFDSRGGTVSAPTTPHARSSVFSPVAANGKKSPFSDSKPVSVFERLSSKIKPDNNVHRITDETKHFESRQAVYVNPESQTPLVDKILLKRGRTVGVTRTEHVDFRTLIAKKAYASKAANSWKERTHGPESPERRGSLVQAMRHECPTNKTVSKLEKVQKAKEKILFAERMANKGNKVEKREVRYDRRESLTKNQLVQLLLPKEEETTPPQGSSTSKNPLAVMISKASSAGKSSPSPTEEPSNATRWGHLQSTVKMANVLGKPKPVTREVHHVNRKQGEEMAGMTKSVGAMKSSEHKALVL